MVNPRMVLVTALVYLALGALGLSFAIPPGYASPIFPAAGFAVAVMLWSGNRAWWGILLGSLILNITVRWWSADLSMVRILVALALSVGSTLQAYIASRLVVWAVGSAWQQLELESDIMRCLLMAGGLACVISASVGVSALYLSGIITSDFYLSSWWRWWVGDSLGVLIGMPIVLSVLFRSHPSWRHRMQTVVFPMFAVLLVVAGIVGLSSYWEQNLVKEDIRKHGELFKQQLQQRFIAHKEAVAALSRLIEVTPNMRHEQFEYFTRITLKDNADIFALSYNPYIRSSERVHFERDMAQEMAKADFKIRERDANGNLAIAAARDAYVPVGLIAPLTGNQEALGYDINSEPIRHEAIEAAIRQGELSITAPVGLVQEKQDRVGLLLIQPAFNHRVSYDVSNRHDYILGFAIGVLKMDELIRIAVSSSMLPGLVYQLEDQDASQGLNMLFQTANVTMPHHIAHGWQSTMQVANRKWRIKVFPTNEYLHKKPTAVAWIVSLVGLFLTAILQVLMLVVTGRTSLVEKKVREQTRELQNKSDALTDSYAQLNAMFALSPDGFIAISSDNVVQYSNPAFQKITGISNADILKQPLSKLEEEFKKRMHSPASFHGLLAYVKEEQSSPGLHELMLEHPRKVVLQIIGMRNYASNIAVILYLRDITSESEVADLKSEFISHAAHELRTPMTSIYGYLELLLKKRYDEKTQREMLEAMHRQSSLIVGMINELLDLARIDARGGKDFIFTEFDLGQLVSGIVSDIHLEQTSRNLILQPTQVPQKIYGDSAKIRQAILNVYTNAEKYSAPDSPIEIAVVAMENRLGVRIVDHGIGMSAEQVKHVGERFWRADNSGSRPGTGLGMSIVKEIVHFHAGELAIQSALGAGTTITLWFPKVD